MAEAAKAKLAAEGQNLQRNTSASNSAHDSEDPQEFDRLANEVTAYIRQVEKELTHSPFRMGLEYMGDGLTKAHLSIGFGRLAGRWCLYAIRFPLQGGEPVRLSLADEASLRERIEGAQMLPGFIQQMVLEYRARRHDLQAAVEAARHALQLVKEGA